MKALPLCMLLAAFACLNSLNAGEPAGCPPHAPPCTLLRDQFDNPQSLCFPAKGLTLLTIADRTGAEEVSAWLAALKPLYLGRVDFRGLANVAGVPGLFQARVRRKFQESRRYPVMMDWSGKDCSRFGYQSGLANLLVIDRDGVIVARAFGAATEPNLRPVREALDKALTSIEMRPDEPSTASNR